MSVCGLSDQLYLDLKIDDKDIPTSMVNFLEEVYVLEDVAGLPLLYLEVNDTVGLFSDIIPLTDSNKFSVTIGKNLQDIKENKSLDFRLFNWKATQYQTGFKYQISCIFDNYKFVKGIKQKAYKGSSTSVIKEVATDCGLDYVGNAECADAQTWLNFSDPLATFANKVTQHSNSQSGCMALAVCANNDIVYKDIIKSINGDPDVIFSTVQLDSEAGDENESYLIREFSPSSSAGFLNAWINYGYVVIEDLLNGNTRKYSSCTLTSDGGSAVINQDVAGTVVVRRDYVPQDCGNTHSNYWKSYHNNIRIIGLFSQKISFLVDSVTNLSLLDVVQMDIYNSATNIPSSYSGKYIIGTKKSLIKGTKYAEIFEVYRSTVPETGEVKLASESPPPGLTSYAKNVDPVDKPIIISGEILPERQMVQPKEVSTLPPVSLVSTDIEIPLQSTQGIPGSTSTPDTSGGGTSDQNFVVEVKNLGDEP